MVVADVDTGIDYTHENFGGPGTVAAYNANDPNFIEPGTFPTKKVIGGYDFVGSNYSVVDDDTTNDIPRPDCRPARRRDDDHGSHTCGTMLPGSACPARSARASPRSRSSSRCKVWDEGDSTDDVLVAGLRARRGPEQGRRPLATPPTCCRSRAASTTAPSTPSRRVAAQRVVDLGTVFVAAAGNAGNQAVGGSAYIARHAGRRSRRDFGRGLDRPVQRPDDQRQQPSHRPSRRRDHGAAGLGADLPAGGLTDDLFDGRELDPPADPGNETPADAQFCDPLPGGSLSGQTVLVFKGSTSSGDCSGSTKVFHAQQAGATAAIMISLFGGAPSALASNGENITIPAVMITGNDGYAILDQLSPGDPPDYNANTVNATLNDATSVIPAYTDAMTDFSSEGPARVTNDLKPDITAPGFDIQSTDAGTGNLGTKLSGTSMATPHVAGVATLLRQLHPNWSPELIKAAMMNHATQKMKDNLLGSPVSATLMGAGRVRADLSAGTDSVAAPASLSFGLDIEPAPTTEVQSFVLRNFDNSAHHYDISGGGPRYSDFGSSPANIKVSLDGNSFGGARSVDLPPQGKQTVWVRLSLDTSKIATAEEEFGWYYFHPNVDGNVAINQSGGGGKDHLHVPWHVAPLAASDNGLSESSLDLSGGGSDTMRLTTGSPSAGFSYADLYQLGGEDTLESHGEEDLVAVGARSFTGTAPRDGVAEGVPHGHDAFGGVELAGLPRRPGRAR